MVVSVLSVDYSPRTTKVWRLLRTVTGQEEDVARKMRQFGIEVYYPQMTERRRVGNRRTLEAITVPVFPSYLFAEVMPDKSEQRQLPGYLGAVKQGENIVLVDDIEIVLLRQREASGEFGGKDAPMEMPVFYEGDEVRIVNNVAFGGMVGKVIEILDGGVQARVGERDFTKSIKVFVWNLERVGL